MRKTGIVVAIISAAAIIIAALINIYPSIRGQKSSLVLAGMVVEQSTNRGIGQATIALAGRTEHYITEDSGNFRIELRNDAPRHVRLHVSKDGFQPLDISVDPEENLVLPLHKQ